MTGLKVREAAARLNVSEKTIYKWLKNGILPAARIGKTWIINEDSLNKLLNNYSKEKFLYTTENDQKNDLIPSHQSDKYSLKRFVKLLENSVSFGVQSILGPRSSDSETKEIIANELKNSTGEIRLMGIGLREFFANKGHARILRSMSDKDKNVSVKAILVDPVGKFARARAVLEDGIQFQNEEQFRSGPLYSDSWRSLNVIVALRNSAQSKKNFKFDARFIDYWPSVYMVMTNNFCFVESYHFGKPDNDISVNSIDGLVPILQVANNSDYYKVLKHHFEYIWNGENPIINIRSLKEISESMKVSL